MVKAESLKNTIIKTSVEDKLINLDYQLMTTSILDNIEIAIVGIDKNGVIFYANEKYGIHIGRQVKSIIGKRLQDVYVGSTTITALKTGKKVIVDKKICPVDASKYVTGIACPLFIDGELKGAFSLYVDISGDDPHISDSTKIFFTEVVGHKFRDSIKELNDYNIIGQSPSFLNVIEKAALIADTDVPVLIRGESGVGKEAVAKFIHAKSKRRNKPFIVVNCAAIPDNLIESELFGYENGSFTGAKAGGKIGKFELANGGTLFLDEVGDMPQLMQTKLLRAIQENEIEKIGSEKTISVDVRIISATNQNIEAMLHTKKFREDLYYRINTFTLLLPPLRERKEDINLLMNYFLGLFNEKYSKNTHLSPQAISFLYRYSWPGNIREFKSCLEHAIIMSEEPMCSETTIKDFLNLSPLDMETSEFKNDKSNDNIENEENYGNYIPPMSEIIANAEKNAIIAALDKCSDSRTEAMKILGINRNTFYRKMKEFNLL